MCAATVDSTRQSGGSGRQGDWRQRANEVMKAVAANHGCAEQAEIRASEKMKAAVAKYGSVEQAENAAMSADCRQRGGDYRQRVGDYRQRQRGGDYRQKGSGYRQKGGGAERSEVGADKWGAATWGCSCMYLGALFKLFKLRDAPRFVGQLVKFKED